MNTWWLFSQVVYDAMTAINDGTPHLNSLINSGLSKFMSCDGLTQTHMFKTVDRAGVNWYLGNAYGIEEEEIEAFLDEWPSDIEAGGAWTRETGRQVGSINPAVMDHMPDDCVARNQDGDCTGWQSATQLKQVVLLPPQALRKFIFPP